MDKRLIEKYNTQVPRYTSYPPANYFSGSFEMRDLLESVVESNSRQPDQVSIYIHIPFCKKMCHYCGCNSCPAADEQTVRDYMQALEKELRMVSRLIAPSRKVSQVHFGGGTPNSVPHEYIRNLVGILKELFVFAGGGELAIECNPAWLDREYAGHLLETGFNRFSLGIQDFNPKVLQNVNRDPSLVPVDELVLLLKSGNRPAGVNLDFIYGLPGQSRESFSETISQAVKIRPDRLVTFSYAHVPWVNKAQKILERAGLPDSEEKNAMYDAAASILAREGYRAIGLDHFVLEDDELFSARKTGKLHRNFQGYCTRETTGQVYAFGVSAISQLQMGYFQNTKSVPEYISSLAADKIPVSKGYRLNQAEIAVREVITQLMCNMHIEWDSMAGKLGMEAAGLKEVTGLDHRQLEQYERDGLVNVSGSRIDVTEKGSVFIRNIAALFDPLMKSHSGKFSKSL